MKRLLVAVMLVVILLYGAFVYTVAVYGQEEEELDFNTRLVYKLAEMLNIPVPTTIDIQYVSQKELRDDYRSFFFNRCRVTLTRENYPLEIVYPECSRRADITVKGRYISGMWFPQKDPTALKVKLDGNTRVLGVLIHEFVHYWLNSVNFVINTEKVVEPIALQILTSQEIAQWIEEGR